MSITHPVADVEQAIGLVSLEFRILVLSGSVNPVDYGTRYHGDQPEITQRMHLVGENRGLRTDPWETTSVRSPGKEEGPAKEL